jgi:hypothetical protein
MSTIPEKSDYLLLLRNTQLEKRLSLDEMQEAMRRFSAWLDRWTQAGAIKSAQPLGNKGKTITGAKSRTMADGPFPEAKEAVGGYILVQAESFDEAVKIASEWPLLEYDAFVEVRPVMDQCATMKLVGGRMAIASE